MAVSGRRVIRSGHNVYPKVYHYTIASFFILMLVALAIMNTWYPTFLLKDEDFLKSFNIAGVKGENIKLADNKILSDRGRMMLFLYSAVVGLVFAGILHVAVFMRM